MKRRLSAHRDGDGAGRLMRVETAPQPACRRCQFFAPSCGDARRTSTHRGMFIVPHGAPEGYEWFVALVVLVGLYFAVRNFMRARR